MLEGGEGFIPEGHASCEVSWYPPSGSRGPGERLNSVHLYLGAVIPRNVLGSGPVETLPHSSFSRFPGSWEVKGLLGLSPILVESEPLVPSTVGVLANAHRRQRCWGGSAAVSGTCPSLVLSNAWRWGAGPVSGL